MSLRVLLDRLRPVGAVGVVVLFLFSVSLLGTATDAAAPTLRTAMGRVVVSDASALGIGWLGAYGLANGSVVAALALSLFTADALSTTQLFLVVAGSRLGAAAIVVFIGALDFFQKRQFTLRDSVSMGLMTFLLTHAIYLPATVVGYAALPAVGRATAGVGEGFSVGGSPIAVFEPLTKAITTAFGPAVAFIVAVGVLLGTLQLFDRLLATVDTATLRRRVFSHFQRTWVAVLIGLLVTTATTSVAFSLGVIVPLYNRGYVEREELIPYVLGANLGTVFDTLIVAVILESDVGVVVVLVLLVVATLLTVLALVFHDRFSRLVVVADDRLLEDRRAFLAFVFTLALVPVALVVVPLALG